MESGECYVCSEGMAPVSPCSCKTLFLHDKCQQDIIMKSNNYICTVCKTPFHNVYYKIIKIYSISRDTYFIVISIFCSILMYGTGIYEFYVYADAKNKVYLEYLYGLGICFMLLGFISTCFGCIVIYNVRVNNIRLIKVTEKAIPKIRRIALSNSANHIV